MSITEKLASLDVVRLSRIHSSLKARDWVFGAMYDEAQKVSMDEWADRVKRELQNRKKGKVTA